MLPKSQRLNLKTDFKRVAAGKKLETKYLKLFIKTGDNAKPRIGIAVSGKSFKKAAERNRAKRLTSWAVEALFPILPAGINIVALPKAGILSVKSGLVFLDLEEKLRNEKIIN
ncbi:ribonuclease P protein component [Candidatus Daviesbacteria bacterium]|nr:ribonuclease P protein component [Candidatus Daviesbacteria bacterium]